MYLGIVPKKWKDTFDSQKALHLDFPVYIHVHNRTPSPQYTSHSPSPPHCPVQFGFWFCISCPEPRLLFVWDFFRFSSKSLAFWETSQLWANPDDWLLYGMSYEGGSWNVYCVDEGIWASVWHQHKYQAEGGKNHSFSQRWTWVRNSHSHLLCDL